MEGQHIEMCLKKDKEPRYSPPVTNTERPNVP